MNTIRTLLGNLVYVAAFILFVFFALVSVAGFIEGKDGAGYYILYSFLTLGIGVVLSEWIKP